jgi:hypothetical protein
MRSENRARCRMEVKACPSAEVGGRVQIYFLFGGGIGAECRGFGADTARNIVGGDVQPKGGGGTPGVHGVSKV